MNSSFVEPYASDLDKAFQDFEDWLEPCNSATQLKQVIELDKEMVLPVPLAVDTYEKYLKLNRKDADILKSYNFEQVSKRINFISPDIDLEKLWIFSHNNIFFIKDIIFWSKIIRETFDVNEYDIPEDFIQTAVENIPEEPFNYESWDIWTKSISEKTGLKGKNYSNLVLIRGSTL